MFTRSTIVTPLLAAIVLSGCADAPSAPHAADPATLFDAVWTEVDRTYPYLEQKHVDWDAVGASYRPLARAARTDAELAHAIGGMLAELHDMHVTLTPVGVRSTMRFVSAADTERTNVDLNRSVQRYVRNVVASEHVTRGIVAPSVAYVRIPSFEGARWAHEVDRAIGASRAVVIDVRGNYGGNPRVALAVAGRFADRERTFGYLRYRDGARHDAFTPYAAEKLRPAPGAPFRGRVYLIVNRRVFSAAEQFVLAMKTLPSVTVIGDTTGGASGGPVVHRLANGWTYQLSTWMETAADGLIVEGRGIAPDLVVRPTADDARSGLDPALEQAIRLATARR